MNPTFNADTLIGQLAIQSPLAIRVFARHHIDYYCGGGRPLGEVCREKGLDVDRVLREIQAQIPGPGVASIRWDQQTTATLIDHIVNRIREPLREELRRLEAMAREVVREHGDKDPDRLSALLRIYLGLKAELDKHMRQEETVLFPAIRKGQDTGVKVPVAVMIHEHTDIAHALWDLRALTGNYTLPEAASSTTRALWFGLEELETDLHEQIHLENNVLFPRALDA